MIWWKPFFFPFVSSFCVKVDSPSPCAVWGQGSGTPAASHAGAHSSILVRKRFFKLVTLWLQFRGFSCFLWGWRHAADYRFTSSDLQERRTSALKDTNKWDLPSSVISFPCFPLHGGGRSGCMGGSRWWRHGRPPSDLHTNAFLCGDVSFGASANRITGGNASGDVSQTWIRFASRLVSDVRLRHSWDEDW